MSPTLRLWKVAALILVTLICSHFQRNREIVAQRDGERRGGYHAPGCGSKGLGRRKRRVLIRPIAARRIRVGLPARIARCAGSAASASVVAAGTQEVRHLPRRDGAGRDAGWYPLHLNYRRPAARPRQW